MKILTTSDLHSYIYPYDYSDNKEKNMGLSRLSTLINEIRDNDTIIIDNGDVLEGSPLSFYHFNFDENNIHPMSRVMNYIGYDYINVGNHDFNYGEKHLLKHLDYLNAKCITCNVLYKNEFIGKSYIRQMSNGKKIGIFGIVTQYIPNWEKEENIVNFKFLNAFEVCKEKVNELKDKVDYIVCVYHGGFERDLETNELLEPETFENVGSKILNEIEGIDILLTGHQHRSISCKVKDTIVTQSASNAKEISFVKINNEITSSLLIADKEADYEMLKLVDEDEKKCQVWLDEKLGESKVDLKVNDEFDARLNKHQVITFLNMVQKDISNADLSSCALFINAKGFNEYITYRDIVSTYTYPNTLVVKKINGKTLKAYLEKCAEYFEIENDEIVVNNKYIYPKLQHFNYDMVDGIDYTIKVSNDVGNRIVKLKYKGKDIKEDDSFSIVLNNYRSSGGGDFSMIKDSKVIKEIQTSMVEILAKYILKNKVIDFEPVNNINVIK